MHVWFNQCQGTDLGAECFYLEQVTCKRVRSLQGTVDCVQHWYSHRWPLLSCLQNWLLLQEKYRIARNNSWAELGITDKFVRARENLGCFFLVDYLLWEIAPYIFLKCLSLCKFEKKKKKFLLLPDIWACSWCNVIQFYGEGQGLCQIYGGWIFREDIKDPLT